MSHRERVRQIEDRLAGRPLIYFGTRGTDARPLLALGAMARVFSQVAPLHAAGIEETCLETLTKRRVDLNRYSIDQDDSDAVREMRAKMLEAFGQRAVLLPYRPTALVASAWFPRSDRVENVGVFHEQQACFEHKPWVETQLSALGVRTIPWQYFSDSDTLLIREAAERGPLVLRANRSDGGAGITLIRAPDDVARYWPTHTDGFLAAARFLSPSTPLNVNACVFADGTVVMHGASLQLIGIPDCTTRVFGYCGNDFAQAAALDDTVLDELETMATAVGGWLSQQGYRGAFGIDVLLHDGKLYLAEVNPRFQGSSRLSAEIDTELNRPDQFLNHIAAFMDLSAPAAVPLRELVRAAPPRAHIVCHNVSSSSVRRTLSDVDRTAIPCSLVPAPDVIVEHEGILVDCVLRERVTHDGMSLRDDILSRVRTSLADLFRQ